MAVKERPLCSKSVRPMHVGCRALRAESSDWPRPGRRPGTGEPLSTHTYARARWTPWLFPFADPTRNTPLITQQKPGNMAAAPAVGPYRAIIGTGRRQTAADGGRSPACAAGGTGATGRLVVRELAESKACNGVTVLVRGGRPRGSARNERFGKRALMTLPQRRAPPRSSA
jgi:hypothetical protein